MKKLIIALLMLSLVFVFLGCGQKTAETETPAQEEVQPQPDSVSAVVDSVAAPVDSASVVK